MGICHFRHMLEGRHRPQAPHPRDCSRVGPVDSTPVSAFGLYR
jgi:hypothetical protein